MFQIQKKSQGLGQKSSFFCQKDSRFTIHEKIYRVPALEKKLVYLTLPEALVKTGPAASLRSLLDQRIRWGAKTPFYRQTDIQAVALLTAVTNLSILLMPLMFLLIPLSWQWLLPAFVLKSLADFTLLYIVAGQTGQKRDLLLFLPVVLLYYPYQGAVLAGMLFLKRGWKGRVK